MKRERQPAEAAAATRRWTRAEVQARNNMNSAAIIIDNLVYDVTEFLEEHPGGAEVLLDNAGRDASQCFRDVGHSDIALEWRKHFLIGEVVAEERRAELPRRSSSELRASAGAGAGSPLSLAALRHVWGPPALLALLAAAAYVYLL